MGDTPFRFIISRFRAFTLAEVLITLAIIGVVSVLTLPSIITKCEKIVTVNKVKSGYAIFSGAVRMSVNDNGEISGWDFSLSDDEFLEKYLLPYLTGVSKSKLSQMTTLANSYYLFWANPSTSTCYILPNGIQFRIGGTAYGYKLLVIDINGTRKPNLVGRDGFMFKFEPDKNRFAPIGQGLTRQKLVTDGFSACAKNISWWNVHYAGEYCAALMMHDGWKIRDDYPW